MPTWGGVARICLWCVFFLWLAGFAVPATPEDVPFAIATHGTPVVPMVTIADDSRFLREDKPIDSRKLNIAWITDSTGIILGPNVTFATRTEESTKLLAAQAALFLQNKYGMNNLSIRLYAQLGMRPIDKLIFFLNAVRNKPDLIVMYMNDLYDFGHYKTYSSNAPITLLPPTFAGYPSLWPYIPLLSSPTTDALLLMGNHLRVIREAVPFKRYIEKKYLERIKILSNPAAAQVRFDLPFNDSAFWICYKILGGNVSLVQDGHGGVSPSLLTKYFIRGATPGHPHSIATQVINMMMRISNEKKIPVLIYMMPLREDYFQNPISKDRLSDIAHYVQSLSANPNNRYVTVIPHIPTSVMDTLVFRNEVGTHLLSSGTLPDFLAGRIRDELEKYHLQQKAQTP